MFGPLTLDAGPVPAVGSRKRRISQLRWARLVEEGETPPSIPTPRSTAGRRGIRFEALVRAQLEKAQEVGVISGLLSHPWIRFRDARGLGWAQPDFIWRQGGAVIVCEAKLTECSDAWVQLGKLYGPLVRRMFGDAVPAEVQACRGILPHRASPAKTELADLEHGAVWLVVK